MRIYQWQVRKLLVFTWGISMDSIEPFNAEVAAALLGFNEDAVLYCGGISGADAHEYAMDYARMLRSRAQGVEVERPRFSGHLFEADRHLIESVLEKMYSKHFVTYRGARRHQ
jgi:hypothetical protein